MSGIDSGSCYSYTGPNSYTGSTYIGSFVLALQVPSNFIADIYPENTLTVLQLMPNETEIVISCSLNSAYTLTAGIYNYVEYALGDQPAFIDLNSALSIGSACPNIMKKYTLMNAPYFLEVDAATNTLKI